MKTQSNSLLLDRLHNQIADVEARLSVKQELYADALKADEPFEKIKNLRLEIKNLRQSLNELQARVTISIHLAEY